MFLFTLSDPPHLSPAGPSVASLKSDCGVKSGPAQKKGLLYWQQVFIVLRPGDDTLYEFRTDLVRIILTLIPTQCMLMPIVQFLVKIFPTFYLK